MNTSHTHTSSASELSAHLSVTYRFLHHDIDLFLCPYIEMPKIRLKFNGSQYVLFEPFEIVISIDRIIKGGNVEIRIYYLLS